MKFTANLDICKIYEILPWLVDCLKIVSKPALQTVNRRGVAFDQPQQIKFTHF